jgi:hypothetical protein
MTFIGFTMTTYGIQTVNFGMKYKYYNIAIVVLFLAGKTRDFDARFITVIVICQ